MANKKQKKCEDWDFLPPTFQNRKDLTLSEKNVLASMCFYHIYYSNYRKQHEGWFFREQEKIGKDSLVSEAQLKRIILKLIMKNLLARRSGTNHKCTHYKLNEEITKFLPQIEEEFESEILDNEPLDKNRLDELSKDESSLVSEVTNNTKELDEEDDILPF